VIGGIDLNILALACFVGLPAGALFFGMARVFVSVMAGTYTNDNIDIS